MQSKVLFHSQKLNRCFFFIEKKNDLQEKKSPLNSKIKKDIIDVVIHPNLMAILTIIPENKIIIKMNPVCER